MTLIYNAVFDKNTRKLSFEDKAGNEIYSCIVPERTPAVDDITKPLTFKATQDGSTVKLARYDSPSIDFQTSRDGGKTWRDYVTNDVISLNTGDEVSFRSKTNSTPEQERNRRFYFEMTGKIEAWHNVMSLYRNDDFATYNTVGGFAFSTLFMSCKSLTKAPVLPATTLAHDCYSNMFWGCESLAEAPALPATTLAYSCYYQMFWGCQSLTKAPVLPATTLANSCYFEMFGSCHSLNEVRCYMPSSYSSSDILRFTEGETFTKGPWLSNVSSTGTFYTNADANWPSGSSGIPTGWNRLSIDNYPTT